VLAGFLSYQTGRVRGTMLTSAQILGPGGRIQKRLPQYEHRTQQLEMAKAVEEAIARPGHLIV